MVKTTHSTNKPQLTALLIILAALFTGMTAQAQGFLKTYASPFLSGRHPNVERVHIYENPNGYTMVSALQDYFSPDTMRHFSVRHTDLKGEETQPFSAVDILAPVYGISGANQTGVVSGTLVDTAHIFLIKNDLNGGVLWQKTVEIPRRLVSFSDVKIAANGEIFVAMLTAPVVVPWSIPYSMTLAKLDADGNFLWAADESDYGTNVQADNNLTLTPAKDGGCFLHHGGYQRYHAARISADGVELWHNSFFIDWTDATLWLRRVAEVGDGGLMLFGNSTFGYSSTVAKHYAPDGSTLWDIPYLATALGPYYSYWPGTLIGNADGTAVIVGHIYKQGYFGLVAVKIASNGTVIWRHEYDDFAYQHVPNPSIAGGIQTSDGGYLLAGTWNDHDVLLKIDANGNLHSNLSVGTVAGDSDLDCTVSAGDVPLPNAILSATGNGNAYWALSDSSGNFQFEADTGNYVLKVQPPSYLWQACADSVLVNFPDTGMVKTVDFPMQAIADCPMMTVDIFTPRLRRCFPNYVGVNYCNLGSTEAQNAQVTIAMDAGLDFNSASIPATQSGQQISVPIGNVAAGQCGTFYFFVTPNCDSTQLGETKCLSAHISPDSICGSSANWSGANIEVSAHCDGDSVKFVIKNTGNAASSVLEYVVLDDHVIMMDNVPFQLDKGAEKIVASLANGHTKRLKCEQEPGHPVGTIPSVGIEACGSNLPTEGVLTQFPNQSGSPFDAMICRQIIGSFDPNDKIASPAGVGTKHFIENTTEIEYLIDFQNTGTDTAFQVVIVDTLSAALDLSSIKAAGASHHYEMKIVGDNIVRFILSNLILPDSGTNEAASHGFVRFKIKPRTGLADGNVIENSAAIFFDFNYPIITNTVFHTIGRDYLPTVGVENVGGLSQNGLQVSPNPSEEMVQVSIENQSIAAGTCRVLDCFGKIVAVQNFEKPVFNVKRNGLPAGVYFLEIVGEKQAGKRISGKVIWK